MRMLLEYIKSGEESGTITNPYIGNVPTCTIGIRLDDMRKTVLNILTDDMHPEH